MSVKWTQHENVYNWCQGKTLDLGIIECFQILPLPYNDNVTARNVTTFPISLITDLAAFHLSTSTDSCIYSVHYPKDEVADAADCVYSAIWICFCLFWFRSWRKTPPPSLQGWGRGCHPWVQNMTEILLLNLWCCTHYCVIYGRNLLRF